MLKYNIYNLFPNPGTPDKVCDIQINYQHAIVVLYRFLSFTVFPIPLQILYCTS